MAKKDSPRKPGEKVVCNVSISAKNPDGTPKHIMTSVSYIFGDGGKTSDQLLAEAASKACEAKKLTFVGISK